MVGVSGSPGLSLVPVLPVGEGAGFWSLAWFWYSLTLRVPIWGPGSAACPPRLVFPLPEVSTSLPLCPGALRSGCTLARGLTALDLFPTSFAGGAPCSPPGCCLAWCWASSGTLKHTHRCRIWGGWVGCNPSNNSNQPKQPSKCLILMIDNDC